MTPKQTNTFWEEIENKIDFLSEHWIMEDNKRPFSFGGWRDEIVDELLALFQKVVDKAIPQKEECYIDFNPKKDFIENLDNSNKIARNDLICKIRASFKDIVEGRESI